MDMVEWNIKETSNNCSYRIPIKEHFRSKIEYLKAIDQCDHWDNSSKACIKSDCPIKIKET